VRKHCRRRFNNLRKRARHHLLFLVANVLFESAIASFKTVVCSTDTSSERPERVGFGEGKNFRRSIYCVK